MRGRPGRVLSLYTPFARLQSSLLLGCMDCTADFALSGGMSVVTSLPILNSPTKTPSITRYFPSRHIRSHIRPPTQHPTYKKAQKSRDPKIHTRPLEVTILNIMNPNPPPKLSVGLKHGASIDNDVRQFPTSQCILSKKLWV